MSKSIYDEALESRSHISAIIQNQKTHLTRKEEMHHLANITRVLLQAQKQEQELNQLQQDISTMIQALSKRNIIIKAFDNVELQAFKRLDDVCVKHLQKL